MGDKSFTPGGRAAHKARPSAPPHPPTPTPADEGMALSLLLTWLLMVSSSAVQGGRIGSSFISFKMY